MKLTPLQLGVLAKYVKDSITIHPVSALTEHKRAESVKGMQQWEYRPATMVDDCVDWSFGYKELCKWEGVLLDFLIDYYSSGD